MTTRRGNGTIWLTLIGACLLVSAAAHAADLSGFDPDANYGSAISNKLLLTGGVASIEGSAGGGLTPWAVIGGYGTPDEIGGNAFYTNLNLTNFRLGEAGAMAGFYNRIEVSFAQQRFNTETMGYQLGLGQGFTFQQNIVGLKVRLVGDAVLDQDTWLPQISIGVQHKKNDQGAVLKAIGAKSDEGTDYYVSATKLFLSESIIVDTTVRFTKANQTGILGFGGDRSNAYKPEFEGSIAYMLSRHLAAGAEYRQKPNNLYIARENDWSDIFVAWAPGKNLTLTLAYADLGNIVIRGQQRGWLASVQIGI